MDVRSGTGIVGEVPARIVGVFINDDWIGIPEPAGCEGDVDGRNTPVPVIEPEPIGAASSEMPFVSGTKPAVETAVLPGMRQVKPWIGTIMTNPMPVPGIDVGSIGMPRLIAKILVLFVPSLRSSRFRRAGCGRAVALLRTVRRNVAVPHLGMLASSVVRLTVVVLYESKSR